jgi:hypothetical protein
VKPTVRRSLPSHWTHSWQHALAAAGSGPANAAVAMTEDDIEGLAISLRKSLLSDCDVVFGT